jgi:hypothetical protein
VLLVPDTYWLAINQSRSDPIVVNSGETPERVLGAIRVLTPEGEETAVSFCEANSGRRLGNYEGTVPLAPRSYTLEDNNSYSDPISLEAGQTVELVTGAIQEVLRPMTPQAGDWVTIAVPCF